MNETRLSFALFLLCFDFCSSFASFSFDSTTSFFETFLDSIFFFSNDSNDSFSSTFLLSSKIISFSFWRFVYISSFSSSSSSLLSSSSNDEWSTRLDRIIIFSLKRRKNVDISQWSRKMSIKLYIICVFFLSHESASFRFSLTRRECDANSFFATFEEMFLRRFFIALSSNWKCETEWQKNYER